ncbi:hypothetical protein VTH82DRAFT_6459 [Thermothelomyces myriococcoides]
MATHLPPGLSPDAVDVVTELSSIITRLRAAQQLSSPGNANATTGATAASGGGGSGGGNKPPTSGANPIPQGGVTGATPLSASVPTPNPQSSNNPTANNNNNTANTGATSSSTANPNPNQSSTSTGSGDKELLSVKDLPFATDNLKHKLQRARAAVRMLGDVRRALAQQEAEARALEERRASQAARLARTQEDGLMFVKAKREESEGVVAMRDMDVDETGGGAGKDGDGNGQTGDGERMVE